MEWFQEHGEALIGGLIAIIGAATLVVGNIDGPAAQKANKWLGIALSLLNRFSAARYKNEPKSLKVPLLQGDSKKRVMGEVDVE